MPNYSRGPEKGYLTTDPQRALRNTKMPSYKQEKLFIGLAFTKTLRRWSAIVRPASNSLPITESKILMAHLDMMFL